MIRPARLAPRQTSTEPCLRRRGPLARAAVFLLLGLVLVSAASALGAETREVTLPDGRFYRIDLPAQRQGAPMILALHGGGGNPDQFARNAGLTRPANTAGYAVIYPAGSGRSRLLTWNAGICCAYAVRAGIDDVAFLDAVVADAARRFGVDAGRVYVTGMSNGSMMAERYAAARPRAVRAAAGVAGTMDPNVRIRGPVPLLHIHGTADTRVPYAGGVGEGSTGARFAPVRDIVTAFARANGVGGPPVRSVIDPVADGTRVIAEDWRDAGGRTRIRLLTVEGGGHVWPGGRRAGRQGGDTRDIDANTEILRFFALHP